MEKDIYIKSEPGGRISFGKMSEIDIDLYKKSISNGTLSKDILFKVKRGLSPYSLSVGVINCGDNNDSGNEGIISLNQIRYEVANTELGLSTEQLYIVYMSLSKVSIEFKIKVLKEQVFEPNKLIEHSTKINLPSCIKHQIYSDLNFNIVTDYSYNGKLIKNANKNIVDRGYEESIHIFSVKKNDVKILYQCFGNDEFFF